jgi:hypothetical protein
MCPAPAALGLGVDGLGRRDVVDVRSDMERVEHLALGHHGRRLELANAPLEVIAIAKPSR